jgi:hypothetical protein
VSNLTLLEATTLGASGSDIQPQGTSGSSIRLDFEPIVLAHQERELAVPADVRMKESF